MADEEKKTFKSQIERLEKAKSYIYRALKAISLLSNSIDENSRLSDIASDIYNADDARQKEILLERLGISADRIKYDENNSTAILGVAGDDNNDTYNKLLDSIINYQYEE